MALNSKWTGIVTEHEYVCPGKSMKEQILITDTFFGENLKQMREGYKESANV